MRKNSTAIPEEKAEFSVKMEDTLDVYDIEFIADGKLFYRYVMPVIESNMYILLKDQEALIVDPHINEDALGFLQKNDIQKITVLLTHEHYDHISGVNWLRTYFTTEVICSEACAQALPDPDRNMARFWKVLIMDKPQANREEGMKLENSEYRCEADRTYAGEMKFAWQVHQIHMRQAPGHSKGGSLICLDESVLFSGDNLVNGTGVICRLPGGSKREYADATRPVLESLPDGTFVFPGHGEPGRLGDLRLYLNYLGQV